MVEGINTDNSVYLSFILVDYLLKKVEYKNYFSLVLEFFYARCIQVYPSRYSTKNGETKTGFTPCSSLGLGGQVVCFKISVECRYIEKLIFKENTCEKVYFLNWRFQVIEVFSCSERPKICQQLHPLPQLSRPVFKRSRYVVWGLRFKIFQNSLLITQGLIYSDTRKSAKNFPKNPQLFRIVFYFCHYSQRSLLVPNGFPIFSSHAGATGPCLISMETP